MFFKVKANKVSGNTAGEIIQRGTTQKFSFAVESVAETACVPLECTLGHVEILTRETFGLDDGTHVRSSWPGVVGLASTLTDTEPVQDGQYAVGTYESMVVDFSEWMLPKGTEHPDAAGEVWSPTTNYGGDYRGDRLGKYMFINFASRTSSEDDLPEIFTLGEIETEMTSLLYFVSFWVCWTTDFPDHLSPNLLVTVTATNNSEYPLQHLETTSEIFEDRECKWFKISLKSFFYDGSDGDLKFTIRDTAVSDFVNQNGNDVCIDQIEFSTLTWDVPQKGLYCFPLDYFAPFTHEDVSYNSVEELEVHLQYEYAHAYDVVYAPDTCGGFNFTKKCGWTQSDQTPECISIKHIEYIDSENINYSAPDVPDPVNDPADLVPILVPTTGELITGGDFLSYTTNKWTSGDPTNFVDTSEFKTSSISGNTYYSAETSVPVVNPWDVNLSQEITITQGETYTLSFYAWTDPGTTKSIVAGLGMYESPWNSATITYNLTDTLQFFTVNITASNFGTITGKISRVIFDMGASVGMTYIDNVSVT